MTCQEYGKKLVRQNMLGGGIGADGQGGEAVADSKAFWTVPEMEISNNVRCAISGMIKQLKILKPAAQIEKYSNYLKHMIN